MGYLYTYLILSIERLQWNSSEERKLEALLSGEGKHMYPYKRILDIYSTNSDYSETVNKLLSSGWEFYKETHSLSEGESGYFNSGTSIILNKEDLVLVISARSDRSILYEEYFPQREKIEGVDKMKELESWEKYLHMLEFRGDAPRKYQEWCANNNFKTIEEVQLFSKKDKVFDYQLQEEIKSTLIECRLTKVTHAYREFENNTAKQAIIDIKESLLPKPITNASNNQTEHHPTSD